MAFFVVSFSLSAYINCISLQLCVTSVGLITLLYLYCKGKQRNGEVGSNALQWGRVPTAMMEEREREFFTLKQ
jgi:hypothetical protein